MSDVKEPQFFARNPAGATASANGVGRFGMTGLGEETLADYMALFAPARSDQLVGDASTFYLWSPVAPQRIVGAQPAARIVAILREPASFLHSLHLQMLQNNTETEVSLRRALELEPARREGRQIPPHANWPAALIYSERVRYAEQLKRYEAHFAPDQMLVLIYDDFRSDNAATLRRVQRFLGVQERDPEAGANANPTVGIRSVRLYSAARNVRAGRGAGARIVRAAGKAITSRGLRERVVYPLRRRLVYSEPQAPDPELMRELRHRFRGEVEALSAHLGRDLVREWGYDGG
jgi:Sulfotransferase family